MPDTQSAPLREAALLRRGRLLEVATLGWNAAGIAVLAFTALAARSIAMAGFGLDSLIEIWASRTRLRGWRKQVDGSLPAVSRLTTCREPPACATSPDIFGVEPDPCSFYE